MFDADTPLRVDQTVRLALHSSPDVLLTKGQERVLIVLAELCANGEPPPSLDRLCELLGTTSRGSMHKHVRALIEAGFVHPVKGRRRGVRVRMDRLQATHWSIPHRVEAPTVAETS